MKQHSCKINCNWSWIVWLISGGLARLGAEFRSCHSNTTIKHNGSAFAQFNIYFMALKNNFSVFSSIVPNPNALLTLPKCHKWTGCVLLTPLYHAMPSECPESTVSRETQNFSLYHHRGRPVLWANSAASATLEGTTLRSGGFPSPPSPHTPT